MASLSGNERPDLRDLLAFYASAGVDDAILDDPIDRFAESAQRQTVAVQGSAQQSPQGAVRSEPARADRSAPPPPPRPAVSAAVPDEAQAAAAREIAAKAATLDELRQIMEGFEGCNLKATAKSMVFADGNPDADLMLVGEAPGRDEDFEGLPFVGRSGQLLDRILAAIGLDRTSAYVANVIPWRPPGNRAPTPHETEICRPFIERQIALVKPKVLVTLDGPPAKVLTGSPDVILRVRGTWKNHTTPDGTVIPVMPTLHPDYLLRNPAHKKLAWRDFLEVKAKLRELGSL